METPYTPTDVAFTKLFASIIHSTVWREEMHVKIVWITMLAMANRRGEVIASVPGLADAARVSLPQCVEALNKLAAPDKWSRTRAYQGRRIKTLEGGWLILNYLEHRERRDADQRRLQTREAVRRYRERKANPLTVSAGKPSKPRKAQAEDRRQKTEAEAEESKTTTKSKAPRATARGNSAASHNEAAPVPGGPKVTWLTPFGTAWLTLYPDGEPPWKFMARYLAPLTKKHTTEAICTQMVAYFKREGQFATWPTFAATFGNGCVVDRKVAAEDAQIIAMVRDQQNRLIT